MPRFPLRASALALAMAAPLLAPAPAPAQTLFGQNLSEADRTALHAEFRAFLMQNPEVIFEAVAEFERRTAVAQADMDGALIEINADEIFGDGVSWVGGNPDGDVTLVEFMDYRCSFCRRAHPQMIDFVEGDGNVRLVIKEFPILGPQSELMSRFAVAVHQIGGDAAYETVHEQLLAVTGDVNDTVLQAMAVELGLDGEAVIARMRAPEVTEILTRNRALAQRLQISGTPSFVMGINGTGEMLRGMVPADELHRVASELRG
jgi:protein-disulfide isomerase